MTLVEAREVTRTFKEVRAVSGVDLTVSSGEIVGLVGANGAGKTTLIRVLLGLVPPSDGEILLFGHPPSRATRRRIGYLPQGLGLYEDLTVAENLDFGTSAYGVDVPALEDDLHAIADVLVRDLPLGLKRRVAFELALSHSPDLLVLDEPTSGVGPLGRARLWDGIRGAAEAGAGVLVTTHHMSEAEQCDRVVVMAAGRVAAAGSMDDVIGDAKVVTVTAPEWAEVYRALEESAYEVALVGRSVRVLAAAPDEVAARLDSAGIEAEVALAPATFEEAFVALARAAA